MKVVTEATTDQTVESTIKSAVEDEKENKGGEEAEEAVETEKRPGEVVEEANGGDDATAADATTGQQS